MVKYVQLNMYICFFLLFPCRYDYGAIERTPCVVHTVQLVVNMVQKESPIQRLLEKVRHLVNKFRKSSVATERLLQKCALVLVKDCPTRRSSCFAMISRCLEVEHLTAVAVSPWAGTACSPVSGRRSGCWETFFCHLRSTLSCLKVTFNHFPLLCQHSWISKTTCRSSRLHMGEPTKMQPLWLRRCCPAWIGALVCFLT